MYYHMLYERWNIDDYGVLLFFWISGGLRRVYGDSPEVYGSASIVSEEFSVLGGWIGNERYQEKWYGGSV